MTISQATLLDYLNDALDARERERVAAALAADPLLRAELEQLSRLERGLRATFDAIRDVRLPAARLGERRMISTRRRSFSPAMGLAGVVVGLLLLGILWVRADGSGPARTGNGGQGLAGTFTPTPGPPLTPTPGPLALAPTATPFIDQSPVVPTATPSLAELQLGSPEWYAYLSISPTLSLRGEVAGVALDVVADGSIVYALMRDPQNVGHDLRTWVTVFDMTTPAAPIELATIPIQAASLGIGLTLAGSELFVTLDQGFQRFDVSNPRAPQLLSAGYGLINVKALAATEQYAYVAASTDDSGATGTLWLYDLANPSNQPLGSIELPSSTPTDVAVVDQMAYVTDPFQGLLIIDVHDPANLRRVGQIGGSSHATAVHVVGTRAYLGTTTTLDIVDVSKPAAPIRLGSYRLGMEASAITFDDNHAYVTTTTYGSATLGGVSIITISDAAAPTLLASYIGQYQAHGTAVVVGHDRFYAAHDARGLLIFDLQSSHTRPSP